MSWFRRLFRIGKAEANAAVDKLEDPIKMTEQGIRDLKANQEKAITAMAEVKAMGIRAKSDAEGYEAKAKEYEEKAIALLKKAQAGELEQDEADRLAGEALARKAENEKLAAEARKNQEYFDDNASKLKAKTDDLKGDIAKYENELKSLKARAKVSEATKEINKDLAGIDSDSTVNMLERMKEKVAQEEALAESYADIANESTSLDQEIDEALKDSDPATSADLAALKAKLAEEQGGE